MHVCMHVCMYVCMFSKKCEPERYVWYVCMHVCMYVCMYVDFRKVQTGDIRVMYACMCAYMYVCMYACAYVDFGCFAPDMYGQCMHFCVHSCL